MSRQPLPVPAGFPNLLKEIKARIRQAQTRAILSVNAELIRLYWDIGRMIDHRQRQEGWGAAVIPRLARALRNELPEEKGFSERNIGRMIAVYRCYPNPGDFLPQAAAKVPATPKVPQGVANVSSSNNAILWSIPWGHHALLMEKVADLSTRRWYMEQTLSGFPLTIPVEALTLAGKTAHSVAGGALFICLERALTLELIRAMAEKKPERVVCLDEGFAGSDQLKANAVQSFKTKGVTSFKTV